MDRNRIEENFLTAMQTIAKAEVAAVKYDQTITCTIVDDSLRESGQYMVSDGTTRFLAYSSITSLKNDTVVYVTVPNGDFTQQKIIVGKQMEGEDTTFLYTAPFDNFIRCTPNLLTLDESTNKGNGYRLYANNELLNFEEGKDIHEEIKDKDGNVVGAKLKTTYNIISNRKDLINYYKDFTRLGIRANFIAWLKEYGITSGDYGLKCSISYQDGELKDSTNLAEEKPTEENKTKYLRQENGFDAKKEYYENKNGGYQFIDLKQENYIPNHYYYKNYVLDYDKTPRVKNLNTSGDKVYYTYYEYIKPDEQTEGTGKYAKVENIEIKYKPGTYYYVPEESLVDTNLQYKLSTDNGFIPDCKYFVIINNKFESIAKTYETYSPSDFQYGVLPIQKPKILDMFLNTKTMLGNVYSFDDYYQQEAVFDISGLGTITGIELSFYENGHFLSERLDKTIGSKVNVNDNIKSLKEDLINKQVSEMLFDSFNNNPGYETLVLNNIEVYMGYETQVLEENEDGYLKLFCYESDKYRATPDIFQNMKNIYLKWAYKKDDGKIYIADQDNVGTFIEQLQDGISDFPENNDNGAQLNYLNNLTLDSSPVQVENRNYYERFMSTKEIDIKGKSGKLGNSYVKAKYNFIPNQGAPYNDGREYFEYGIYPKNDENKSNVLAKKYLKKEVKEITSQELVEPGIQYLKKLSTGDYLYQYPAIGTHVEGNSGWYKYDYEETKDENSSTFIKGYKKVFVDNTTTKEALYNYYYVEYFGEELIVNNNNNQSANDTTTTLDNEDYMYICYLYSDMSIMTYKPNYYYYYNCPNNLFEVKWYRYRQGAPAADEFCGIYWEEIPNLPKLIEAVLKDKILSAEEQSNAIQNLYDQYAKVTHLINDFQCELHPDYVYNKEEEIKAIIFLTLGEEKKIFYSEPIKFFNESPTVDLPSLEVETALAPKFDDGSLGNYYLYGENNSLIDMGDAQTQRSISLLFDVAGGAAETRSLLKNADKVTWIFPLKNTMIVPSLSLMTGTYTIDEKINFGYFEDNDRTKEEYKFYYTIDKYYSYSYGDNTIICNVVKDGILYSTTANMSFGQSGSNGSEYTLVLDLMTADSMITLNPTNNLYYKGLVKYMDMYPISEGQSIHPYPEKNKESEGFYYLENADEDVDEEGNTVLKNKIFKKINIDDYDWLTIGYNDLYVVREFQDKENKRSQYPCLDEYLYQHEDGEKSKVNIHSNPRDEEIKIVANLYDQNHKRIDINEYTINWEWEIKQGSGLSISTDKAKKNQVILIKPKNTNIDIDEDMYIISATLSGLTDYDLTSSLSLPLRKDFGPVKYQGPVEILHNSLGVPQFYKDEMHLYYNDKEGKLKQFDYNNFEIYFKDSDSVGHGLHPVLKKEKNNEIKDEFIDYDLYDATFEAQDLFMVSSMSKLSPISFTSPRTCKGYYEFTSEEKKGEITYNKYKLISDTKKRKTDIYNFCNLYKIAPKTNFRLNGFYFNINNPSVCGLYPEANEYHSLKQVDKYYFGTDEKWLQCFNCYIISEEKGYTELTTTNNLNTDIVYYQKKEVTDKILYKEGNDEKVYYTPSEYQLIIYGNNNENQSMYLQKYVALTNEDNNISKQYRASKYELTSIDKYNLGEYKKIFQRLEEKSDLEKAYTDNRDIFNEKLKKYSTDDIDKVINGQSNFNDNNFYIFAKYKQDYEQKENEIIDDNQYYITEIVQVQDSEQYSELENYFTLKYDYVENPEVNKEYYTPIEYIEIKDETQKAEMINSNLCFVDKTIVQYIKIDADKIQNADNIFYKQQFLKKIDTTIATPEKFYICLEELEKIKIMESSNDGSSLLNEVTLEENGQYVTLSFKSKAKIEDPNKLLYVKTNSLTIANVADFNCKACFFQPPSIYIANMNPFSIKMKHNNNTIFSIPILYTQNKYFSSTINRWDGKLNIDEEKNTILAKMIGAGRKDSNNTFTGVIMGDWSGNNNSEFETGIYGFHSGETSFGFTENGQGFIGKAGHGRIVFDGDNAQLRSANYENGPFTTDNNLLYSQNGMLIDLDDAFLLTTNDKAQYIKINGLATAANTNHPVEKPLPGKDSVGYTDYPFVIYGGENLYTEIGWNGDLRLKGSAGSKGEGQISLDASGEIPFEIKSAEKTYNENTGVVGIANRYVQINWDASIILSSYENGFTNKILLDASAPKLAPLPAQYHLTEDKKDWEPASKDRPFQIGQYLRATWDGYLEAQGAYFKNSNANVFNIHYENNEGISKDNFFIGRTIAGNIGFLSGFNGQGATQNLGIQSTDNHGIKLTSATNLSITATKTKNSAIDNIEQENGQVASARYLAKGSNTITPTYIYTTTFVNGIDEYYWFGDNKIQNSDFPLELNQQIFNTTLQKIIEAQGDNYDDIRIGYKNDKNLIQYTKDTLDTTKQYYCQYGGANIYCAFGLFNKDDLEKFDSIDSFKSQICMDIYGLTNYNVNDLKLYVVKADNEVEDDSSDNEGSNTTPTPPTPEIIQGLSGTSYTYTETDKYVDGYNSYYIKEGDSYSLIYHNVYEDGTVISIDYVIDNETDFADAQNIVNGKQIFYLLFQTPTGAETSDPTASPEGLPDWNDSLGNIGGIYVEASDKINLKTSRDNVSTLLNMDNTTISNFITNKFEILNLQKPVTTDGKIEYENLFSLVNGIVTNKDGGASTNKLVTQLQANVDSSIFTTRLFQIQAASNKVLLDLGCSADKGVLGIHTKDITLSVVGNDLTTNGGIRIQNNNYKTGYGLYVQPASVLLGAVGIGGTPNGNNKLTVHGNTYLTGNLGIGTPPTSAVRLNVNGDSYLQGNVGIGIGPQTGYKLYVSGKSYFTGDGTFNSNLNVNGKSTLTGTASISGGATNGTYSLSVTNGGTTTDTLLAGSTIGYSIKVNSNGIVFTGGASGQSGIYARFA